MLVNTYAELRQLQKTCEEQYWVLYNKLWQEVYDNFNNLIGLTRKQGSNLTDIVAQEYKLPYSFARDVVRYVNFRKLY